MSNMNRYLLVVEDDVGIQNQLRWCFDDFEVLTAGNRSVAMDLLRLHRPTVVLLDLGLPPDPGGTSEGLATLDQILELAPHTKVIVVTGNDERESAVRAIGAGAHDYYQKPIERDEITRVVERAHRVYELEIENQRLLATTSQSPLDGVITQSEAMLAICRTVEKVAPSDVSTLLLGESGTGKELLARALHELSTRADKPIVSINCAAIPDNLLESELFGYEKGAFTGAVKQTQGKIEYADGGTLFLDEIGDLPFELQAKILRFLQERVIERVGGRTEIPIDVRLICATHQNLESKINDGQFRNDLYYRISEVSIVIPPLRERSGDVAVLSRTLLERYCGELSKPLRKFSEAALNAMERHSWPGNIRELENRVKRGLIMSEGNTITPADLELESPGDEPMLLNLKEVRSQAEMTAIQRALKISDNNLSKTAKLLGISRPTLYDALEKYGLRDIKR